MYKAIEYAYPSSPLARDSGFGLTGCFLVCLYDNEGVFEEGDPVLITESRQVAIDAYMERPEFENKPMMKFFNGHF